MRWISLAVALLACRSRTTPVPRAEIEITTELPGATAAVIESAVTTPLERQLGQIPHLADMRSRSTFGSSTIDLAFEPGTDSDASTMAVQQAINDTSNLLPRTLPAPPTYHRIGKVIARYAFRSEMLALPSLREAIDPVEQKLHQVAGVGVVEICGAGARETHLDIDPAMLAGAALTPLDVVDAVKKAQSLADPRSVVVATRNGAPIRIADVAVVFDSSAAPTCIATSERGRIVELIVTGQTGVDSTEVRERIDAVMPRLVAMLPAAVTMDPIGVMHVLAVVLHAVPIDHVREATTGATHVLIEQRGNNVRLGVEADDDTFANIRGRLERIATITVVEPDATLELTGADPDELRAFAKTITSKLGAAIPIGLDQDISMRIEVDRDRLAALGVSSQDFDGTLAALVGVYATTVFMQTTQIPVIVRVKSDHLDGVNVRSVRGDLVPLSAVAQMVTVPDGERWHVGQFPMVGFRVHASTAPDLAELHAPPSIHVRLVPD
ncbi:MAG TPA: efflux RND transporter permease subunit [Kofleriaceae bacterium]|nr:efflux RND transporter permease subunit [Kofleriaceae bacterium]